MGLSEPISGSHVASASGPVPHYIPPPPSCSYPDPLSDSNSASVHLLPSQQNPNSSTYPSSSSALSSDLPPPPPPQPLPSSFQASGAPPAASVSVPIPSIVPILAHLPGHNLGLASANAQSPPPPPIPGPQPHLPLLTPSSVPLSRHPRSSSSSNPLGSAPPPQQLSYAQAAQHSRGPSFVRAHAIEVEPFARIPRTGANIICGSREGIPSFSFVSSDLPKVEEIYSNALVMKFSGGRPSLEASHKEIVSWGMEQSFSIGPLSSRAFLLRFQDNKDLLKVLTRPSSILITFPYKVFRWHNLCHMKEDSCLAPVWISLPRLPLQCFIPEFLESVGNKLGRFLCFDKATTTLARPSAARICVELDLRKPPPQFIWIGLFEGFKQPIIYERMPKFCIGCHMLGHMTIECSKSCTDMPADQIQGHQTKFHRRPPTVRQNADDISVANYQGGHVRRVTPTTTNTVIPPPPLNSDPYEKQAPILQPLPSPGHRAVLGEGPASHTRPTNFRQHSNPVPPHRPENPSDDPLVPILNEPRPILRAKSNNHKNKSKKKKSVSFNLPGQSNLSANREYWNAVNTQVAILEQQQSNINAATTSATPSEGDSQPPSNAITHSQSDMSSDDSSCSSIAADSPPPSPRALSIHSHPESYASEGEEGPTEPSPMLGHNTDEMLDIMPLNPKRNKRHPDQPLKVQLRVRKDPNPSI